MRKLVLILVLICAAAAVAAIAKLHSQYTLAQMPQAVVAKLLSRFGVAPEALCQDVPCPHFTARIAVIESIIRQEAAESTYLAIGDSITEMADLPQLCGYKPINAGIASASVETFEMQAQRLADLANPKFIIISLGTNNALRNKEAEFKDRMTALVASLAKWPVIVVPLPLGSGVKDASKLNATIAALQVTKAIPLKTTETMDGVHLTAASYVEWKNNIADAIP